MTTKSIQITISGRVQNVGFRYSTQQKAKELGINGFVKNKPNGDVYCEAEADEDILNQFVLWCHKGPDWAKVMHVQVNDRPVKGFEKFEIKR